MQLQFITPVIKNSSAINSTCKGGLVSRFVRSLSGNRSVNSDIILSNYMRESLLLSKLKNFTIDEYKKLTQNEINDINGMIENYVLTHRDPDYKDYQEFFNKALNYHDQVATGIKEKCDSEYGAGQYVVISIGRSLSSICKCLGYKIGEDNVKQLPMSDADRFLRARNFRKENFDAFNEYLDSIGLSKKEIEESGKKYIFIDYCFTGRSLQGVKNLLISNYVYGNLDNIVFADVINLLSDFQPNRPENGLSLSNEEFIYNIKNLLVYLDFKKYSQVQKCKSLANTKNAVINPTDYSYEMRAFFFKLLDNEMTKRNNFEL